MSYVNTMSLEQLARYYKDFSDEQYLEELKRRDRISKMTCDEQLGLRFEEPDNQMTLEFPQPEGDTSSGKDEWSEAYEAGYAAGKSTGQKEGRLPSSLPPFVPLSPGTKSCECTTCGCEELATYVFKTGLCVCDDCLHCPASPGEEDLK